MQDRFTASLRTRGLRLLWFPALALAVTPAWPADDVAAIRNVTTSHLDNTNSHVDVGPLVIVGDHALADWVQGTRGAT
jgi:hypothetical protein